MTEFQVSRVLELIFKKSYDKEKDEHVVIVAHGPCWDGHASVSLMCAFLESYGGYQPEVIFAHPGKAIELEEKQYQMIIFLDIVPTNILQFDTANTIVIDHHEGNAELVNGLENALIDFRPESLYGAAGILMDILPLSLSENAVKFFRMLAHMDMWSASPHFTLEQIKLMILGRDALNEKVLSPSNLMILSEDESVFDAFLQAGEKLYLEAGKFISEHTFPQIVTEECVIMPIVIPSRRLQNAISQFLSGSLAKNSLPIVTVFIVPDSSGVSYRFVHNEEFSLATLKMKETLSYGGHPQASGGRAINFLRLFASELGREWLAEHLEVREKALEVVDEKQRTPVMEVITFIESLVMPGSA